MLSEETSLRESLATLLSCKLAFLFLSGGGWAVRAADRAAAKSAAKKAAAKKPAAKPAAKKSPSDKTATLLDRARRSAKAKLLKLRATDLAADAGGEVGEAGEAAACDLEAELAHLLPSDEEADHDDDHDDIDEREDPSPAPAAPPSGLSPAGPVGCPPCVPDPTEALAAPVAADLLVHYDLRDWVQSFKSGVRRMKGRDIAARTMSPDPSTRYNLSLVMMTVDGAVDIAFVYWSRVLLKIGTANKVRIDTKTRNVKYTIANSLGTPELPLQKRLDDGSAVMIHPDIGITMNKPRDCRTTIPDDMWRLSEQWQAATSRGIPALSDRCHLCFVHRDEIDDTIRTCPLCLTTSHDDCCRRSTRTLFGSYASLVAADEHISSLFLPPWWRVCALCSMCTGHTLLLSA